MWTFAWRNLMTRPLRTVLGLVGLSVPILGFIGLFSLSDGLRNLVGNTLDQIQGVMVLRENVMTPVFSDLPAEYAQRIQALPEVQFVAPEIWKIAPPVDGKSVIPKAIQAIMGTDKARSVLDTVVICGQDIVAHQKLRSAVFPKKMIPPNKGGGRFLQPGDINQNVVVISKKIANDFPDPSGRPRQVGDEIQIGKEKFKIIGMYNANSLLLDVTILMDIQTARRLMNIRPEQVSCIYVEGREDVQVQDLAATLEKLIPDTAAQSTSEFLGIFGNLMKDFDLYLYGIVGLALVVGVVGIINTMLMSTTERFTEFGVLRTNGWSKWHVMLLVTAESAYIGLLSGAAGCTMSVIGVFVANQFLEYGLQLSISLRLLATGLLLSVIMAMVGGFYPSWRASRMVPMDAIRLGAH